MSGEELKSYLQLSAAVRSQLQPKTFFDKLKVKDVTDSLWEEYRFKRNQVAMIEAAAIYALTSLLAPIVNNDYEEASNIAADYYGGDKSKKTNAAALMKEYNITAAKVEAAALHLRSSSFQALDRMISSRGTVRNGIIRDYERRQRKAEKAKRREGHKMVKENGKALNEVSAVKSLKNGSSQPRIRTII